MTAQSTSLSKKALVDEHYARFLTHCTRDKNLLRLAAENLESDDLKAMGFPTPYVIVFWVIQEYWTQYGETPDRATLRAEFKAYVTRHARSVEQAQKLVRVFKRFMQFMPEVEDTSRATAYELLQTAVDQLKVRPAIRDTLERALSEDTYDDLSARIDQLSRQRLGTAKSLSVNNATQFVNTNQDGQRLKTYIQWFDARVSSPGPVRGGCMGIIGPMGGGKTTFGIQLAVQQALAGRHSALILVEEWSNSVRRKLLACATGIPTNEIERHGDDLERAVVEGGYDMDLVLPKRQMLDQYLHIVDLTNEGGCEEVENELSIWKQQDRLPDYLYLDWAGELADRMVQSDERFKDNKRGAIEYIMKQAARWAKDYDIFTAVSQQMDAETAKKGPFAKSSQYSAMDCRSFAAHLKYCIILNPKDENTGLQIVRFGKVRDDAPVAPFCLRLRGEISQFEDASAEWDVNTGGRIVRSSKRRKNELPEE